MAKLTDWTVPQRQQEGMGGVGVERDERDRNGERRRETDRRTERRRETERKFHVRTIPLAQ